MDISHTEPCASELPGFLSGFVTEHKLRLFETRLQQRTRFLTVVLEDLFQTHNASACLRSCDSFGIQDVHIIENRYRYEVNPEIELGSARWLTIHRHSETEENTAECLARLRSKGYRIAAMCPHGESQTLDEFDLSQPTAFLFGTEAAGLSQVALDEADCRVQISTHGFAESLNISVAVAVSMHHFSHRLRQTDIDWHLTEPEQAELRLTWLRQAIGKRRLPAIESAFR